MMPYKYEQREDTGKKHFLNKIKQIINIKKLITLLLRVGIYLSCM